MHRSMNDERRMTMIAKSFIIYGLLPLLLISAIGIGRAQSNPDIKGIWSGTSSRGTLIFRHSR